jgi:hypothetical protein
VRGRVLESAPRTLEHRHVCQEAHRLMRLRHLLFWILALAAYAPAHGHHSFAVYDFAQEIEFEGVVATLNFKNPHIAMTLARTNENGETEIIDFVEGAPANMLARMGLRPKMLEPGTHIKAIGSPLRSDPTKYFLRSVILSDGREFDATRNARR